MIYVNVYPRVKREMYVETLMSRVRIPGHERLTPAAARAACRIAFGSPGGVVTCDTYGYRVYANSVRKFYL